MGPRKVSQPPGRLREEGETNPTEQQVDHLASRTGPHPEGGAREEHGKGLPGDGHRGEGERDADLGGGGGEQRKADHQRDGHDTGTGKQAGRQHRRGVGVHGLSSRAGRTMLSGSGHGANGKVSFMSLEPGGRYHPRR